MDKTTRVVNSSSLTSNISKNTASFLIAEYSAIRAELLKRMEVQHQLISIGLVAAGTFLSLGLQSNSTTILLIYPPLAFFLATAWAQNDFWILSIDFYIKNNIENRLLSSGLGWEHNRPSGSAIPVFGSLALLASRGVIVGTQAMVVSVSLLKTRFSLDDIILFIVDGISILLTLLILRRRKPRNLQAIVHK